MNAHNRRVAGQRLPRLDGIGKVTGKHVYAADFTLPGMLFGKVLRSRRAHALIRKLDISRAAAIPGVRGIITSADIPAVRFGQAVRDTSVFALDRVLFAIEPAKQLRLVILDACRDNPFAKTMKRTIGSRAIGRGLAIEVAGAIDFEAEIEASVTRIKTGKRPIAALIAVGGGTSIGCRRRHLLYQAQTID